MIILWVLTVFVLVLKFIISLVSIPAAPLVFLNAINNVVPYFAFPIVVLKNYIGASFFTTMITLIITSLTLFIVLRPGIWFYNKIRGSGGGA